VFFSGVESARAAILYLDPPQATFSQNETFLVDVRIDTQGECFNAVQASINYSPSLLEAIDFNQGNSILSLWVNPPSINKSTGLISFAGGVPGGYCGEIPGMTGKTNLLGKIAFKTSNQTQEKETAQISFGAGQVLLNDGLGTAAKLSTKPAVFTILPQKASESRDQLQEAIKNDKIPPEAFVIQLGRDSSLFDNEYFIVFSTADKQTGVDYYEINEGSTPWQKTQSPYHLKDQNLNSIIKVKAVDKAGNEQIATLEPLRRAINWRLIFLVLVLLAASGFFLANRKKHAKKHN
jgi:hypothetical protein